MWAAGERKTKYYLLQNYFLRQGTQPERLHKFLSESYLSAVGAIESGPKLVMEAQVAAYTPQVAVIVGLSSLEAVETLRAKLAADAAYQKAVAAWEAGPEPPYEQYTQTLLRAADYSSDIPTPYEKAKSPRIFELRVYHSPTTRQLAAVHERFSAHEIGIFHRSGVNPLFYTETVVGANMPNLTYVIPFESLAAREKAWNAFGADPEWAKVRKDSIDKGGQIVMCNQISLFRATPYSPIS